MTMSTHLVSHLLFVDDSLLFFRAKKEDCKAIVDILKCYERCSGQLVNLNKSGI